MHRLVHHSHEDRTPYPEEECPIARSMRTGEAVRVESEVLWRKDGRSFPGGIFGFPIMQAGCSAGPWSHSSISPRAGSRSGESWCSTTSAG